MTESRIKGLYRLDVRERIDRLAELGWLSQADAELLRQGHHTLHASTADKMVENVVGVYGLPFAIAPNFIINGRETIVPMVVEEPSVVAAVSKAALDARDSGGFTAKCPETLLIGQVYVNGVSDIDAAVDRVTAARDEIQQQCNDAQPRLVARGGGARDLGVRKLDVDNTLVVHVLVDTCDAMGANLVNTMCEAIAPRIATLCGGQVALRILSNLADRSIATARVSYDVTAEIRDGIVLASEIAAADPYRAATHNKGIMNGIDAVAVATGNDWRAIEAGAHAYAARGGRYSALATWSAGGDGSLVGEISIPLKVGIVGGNLDANPGAGLGQRIAGVESAVELAELMAAVGLAQNFAALRALATTGIQEGHMKLHARAAGVRPPTSRLDVESADGVAAAKVILLGEHAVVYGKHALALPIPDAVTATLGKSGSDNDKFPELRDAIELIAEKMGVDSADYSVKLNSRVPLAMGLGSSAAVAVAIARAFNNRLKLGLDDDAINDIAFACEKLAHGTPSGIDNTIATFGRAILFRKDGSLLQETVDVRDPLPIVVACSHERGRTSEQVAGVRARRDKSRGHYDAIFDRIDTLSLEGAEALRARNYAGLGRLMNICHGLLNALEVSTAELESMVGIARSAGAAGAKLTGSGGGGSIVALCPGAVDDVRSALQAAGFRTIELTQ